MCNIPLEIANEERVLRAIRTPAHVKNKKLKTAALKSPAGEDEVSVMRYDHMGVEACRTKAKEILGVAYIGMAVLRVEHIREHGSSVIDTRIWFCGHADIKHAVVIQPDEPPESQRVKDLNERIRKMLALATYHEDPDPTTAAWSGTPF